MAAYSFADLRIKSMQIKGERPVIVILSGAGLSAESGIPTYRNADNNWNRTDSMDSVDMKHHPQLVWNWDVGAEFRISIKKLELRGLRP